MGGVPGKPEEVVIRAVAAASTLRAEPAPCAVEPVDKDLGAGVESHEQALGLMNRGARGVADRIEVNPNVHSGKPCVAGTRIPIADVLELVGEGLPFQQIIRDHYPDLAVDDIRACVKYAIEVLGVEDLHVASGP